MSQNIHASEGGHLEGSGSGTKSAAAGSVPEPTAFAGAADLQRSISLLNAALESTADGLLMADRHGGMVSFNRRFAELWRLPAAILESRDEEQALAFVLAQLRNPEAFLQRVRELYARPEEESFDTLEFKDGRVFERYSRPQRLGGAVVGRVWSFRDVSERRRVERALQESEERLRATFEQAAVGIAHVGTDGRFLRVNPRLCAIVGYERDELLARTFQDITHPDDLESDLAQVQQMLAGALSTYTLEKRYLRKDGSVVWVQLTVALVRDGAGRPEYFISAIEDISERREFEEALGALVAGTASVGQDFFRSLVRELARALKVRYAFVGRALPGTPQRVQTVALWANGALADNITYDLEGTPCDLVVGRALCFFRSGVAAAFPRDVLLAEMGVESYLGAPLFHPGGQTLGLLVVLHDRPLESERTARSLVQVFASRAAAELHRLEAESALRESEERYKAIFHGAPDAVLLLAADGPAAGTILATNEAAERMHGYGPGELVGLSICVLDAPEAARLAPDRLRRLAAGEPLTFEIEHRRRDGTLFPVEVTARRIDMGGRPCVLAFDRDITARKAAEEQLRQAQKMEALGRLAGGVAHDFNNILGAILGNADLARRDLDVAHPAAESLDEILRASRRAKTLVQQILSFTRQQQPERRAVALGPIVEEVVRLLRATLPAGAGLVALLDAGVPMVLADPTQIHQALLNLGTNAWQALPGGVGRIEVRLTDRRVDSASAARHPDLRPGRYAVLTVSDNGRGMTPATLQRLFEPFFTTKAPGEGTGLGLSVVHGVMKSHEGAVLVSSEPGRGTVFELYFPAAEIPSVDASGPRGIESTSGPGGEPELRSP